MEFHDFSGIFMNPQGFSMFLVYFSKVLNFKHVSFTIGFRVRGRRMATAFPKMWEAAPGGISKPERCTSLNLGFHSMGVLPKWPKWVVYWMENAIKKWMTTGDIHISGNTHANHLDTGMKWSVAQSDGYMSDFFESPMQVQCHWFLGVVSRIESWTFNQPLRHQPNKGSLKRLFTS